jgi:hypothetical protein
VVANNGRRRKPLKKLNLVAEMIEKRILLDESALSREVHTGALWQTGEIRVKPLKHSGSPNTPVGKWPSTN